MLNAEELGVTSKNIDQALQSAKPDVKRLVGTEGSYGEQIGLTKDWAARVIRLVGNYGEVYDRNVGVGTQARHSARPETSCGVPAAFSTRRRSADPDLRPTTITVFSRHARSIDHDEIRFAQCHPSS